MEHGYCGALSQMTLDDTNVVTAHQVDILFHLQRADNTRSELLKRKVKRDEEKNRQRNQMRVSVGELRKKKSYFEQKAAERKVEIDRLYSEKIASKKRDVVRAENSNLDDDVRAGKETIVKLIAEKGPTMAGIDIWLENALARKEAYMKKRNAKIKSKREEKQ
eukprot:254814_1